MTNEFKIPVHGYVKMANGEWKNAKVLGVSTMPGLPTPFFVEGDDGRAVPAEKISPYADREICGYKVYPIEEGFLFLNFYNVPHAQIHFTMEEPTVLSYELVKETWDFMCLHHEMEGVRLKHISFRKSDLSRVIGIVDLADPDRAREAADRLLNMLGGMP